jgi:hypothetical protein
MSTLARQSLVRDLNASQAVQKLRCGAMQITMHPVVPKDKGRKAVADTNKTGGERYEGNDQQG